MSDSAMLRHLVRKRDRAALASLMSEDGSPYASMVMTATDHRGNVILLLSDLAVHSRNIAANGSVSLLFEDDFGTLDPLLGLRASLQARIEKTQNAGHIRRYLNRHPSAAEFAGFADFNFYLAAIDRLHVVAGFGQIKWVDKKDYLLSEMQAIPIAETETETLEFMNAKQKDLIEHIAVGIAGKAGGDWTLSGIDAEGYDLRNGTDIARLDFETPVKSAREIQVAFAVAAEKARANP